MNQFLVNRILLFTLLFPIVGTATAIGQAERMNTGHYLDSEGKKQYGSFSFANLSSNVIHFYHNDGDAALKKLFPNDVTEVFIEGNPEIVISTTDVTYVDNTETIFIVPKLVGQFTFYEGFSSEEGKLFFIKTNDRPEVVRINRQSPRRFFKTYLGECGNESYKPIPYTRNSLLKVLTDYHECLYPNQSYHVFAQELNPLKLKFGVNAFLSTANPTLTGHYKGDYESFTTGGIGVTLRLNVTSSFSLNAGINYLPKTIFQPDSVDHKIGLPIGQTYYEVYYRAPIKLTYSTLEIPLSFSYHFYNKKRNFAPFISAGASVLIHFNREVVNDFGSWQYSVPAFPDGLDPEFPELTGGMMNNKAFSPGFFMELGLAKVLFEKVQLELSARYTYEIDYFKTRDTGTRVLTNRGSIVLSAYF